MKINDSSISDCCYASIKIRQGHNCIEIICANCNKLTNPIVKKDKSDDRRNNKKAII